MTLDIQFKLKSNPLYIKYLHGNSHWYKILNREPDMFDKFVQELKEKYKLRPSDRLNNMISTFEMVSSIISALNTK